MVESVALFFQRTCKKFDYYAGGRFLRQPKQKQELKEEPMPPPKKKRKFKARLRPSAVPISSSPRTRLNNNKEGEHPNGEVQQTYESEDRFPLNLFERRIRHFKPPPQVAKPPTNETSMFQSSKDNTTQEFPIMYNLRRRSYKQLHYLIAPPAPVTYNTITLYDEECEKVEEYRIFKEDEKFCGELVNFSDYAEDCRDSDVQTTCWERQAGEERSAHVLSKTVAHVRSMKAEELSYSCRLTKLLARFNYEE